jgi:hypothetical protein
VTTCLFGQARLGAQPSVLHRKELLNLNHRHGRVREGRAIREVRVATVLETQVGATERTPAEAGTDRKRWPLWQRVLFRFFFVYLLLQIAPWNWFGRLPLVSDLTRRWYQLVDWAVQNSNAHVFHVRETLVQINGSGDTSWAWTQLWLFLSLALIAGVVWSVLDRRRLHYDRLAYWLRTMVRYYIATAALAYGIIKLFALQMPFPNLSQLSTPLGDLLPMRLSWLFLGYSFTYQFFSGLMETVAGLLLLYRRTVTLGLLAATGAFANVVMINLSYDVPVKLYASHLLFACLFLLAWDARRLFQFFILNRPAQGTTLYEPPFTRVWQRVPMWAVWCLFVWWLAIDPFRGAMSRYATVSNPPAGVPFPVGIYDVQQYVVNGQPSAALLTDSLRWRDVIFDANGSGSINTRDRLFWHRYGRGYFRFKADTAQRTAVVWKTSTALDSVYLFDLRYEIPDSTTIRLWALIRDDSVFAELVRSNRHFQLAERQFHWLSEYNR